MRSGCMPCAARNCLAFSEYCMSIDLYPILYLCPGLFGDGLHHALRQTGQALNLAWDNYLGGLAVRSGRKGLEGADAYDLVARRGLVHELDGVGGGPLDSEDGLGLALGLENLRLLLGLGAEYCALVFAFSGKYSGLLLAFGAE